MPIYENKTRTKILQEKFFPPLEDADLSNIKGAIYLELVPIKREITAAIITAVLKKIHPDKALEPNGITIRVLKEYI